MDASMLKQTIIDNGGNECLLGIIYDNNSRTFFDKNKTFSDNYIQGETLIFDELSIEGIEVRTVKFIDNIQGLIFVKDPDDKEYIDSTYFRS